MLPRTHTLLAEHLHPNLCTMIVSYVRAAERDNWSKIAFAGEFETCMSCPKDADELSRALHGACCGGYLELAEFLISKGANIFHWGLNGACLGGHRELVDFMISKGKGSGKGTDTDTDTYD